MVDIIILHPCQIVKHFGKNFFSILLYILYIGKFLGKFIVFCVRFCAEKEERGERKEESCIIKVDTKERASRSG